MQPEDALMIGILVADFLFNTSRWNKAIALLIDCLVLLKGLTTCKVGFPNFRRGIYSRCYSAGNLLNERGWECFKRSQFEQSIKYHEKALFVFKEISSRSEEAISYFLLGRSLSAVSKYDEAIKHYQKALQISEIIGVGRQVPESWVYYIRGEVHKNQGKYDEALSYYVKALEISKATGNKFQEAVLYFNLGVFDFECLGKLDEALVYFQKALNIFTLLKYTEEEIISRCKISEVYFACGECEKALEYSKKSLSICKVMKNLEGQGTCYNQMCSLYLSLDNVEKVIENLRNYVDILHATGERKELGLAYVTTGIAYMSTSVGQSISYLQKSLQIHKDSGDRYGEAMSVFGLGWVYFYHGKNEKALEYVKRAIDITEEIGESKTGGVSYALSSSVYAAEGQIEKAIVYLNKALDFIKEAGTRRHGSQNGQFAVLRNLGSAYIVKGEFSKAHDCFLQGIKTHIKVRSSFEYDMVKLALDDGAISCYKALSWLLLCQGKEKEALFTLELGRSRALIDLLSNKYGIQGAADVSEISSSTLQSFFQKQQSNFLFMAVLENYSIGFWFVDKIGNIKLLHLGREQPREKKADVNKDFGVDILKNHDVTMQCEDRSLTALYDEDPLEELQERINSNEQGDTNRENTEKTIHLSDECPIKALLYILGRLSALMHRIADIMDGPEIIIAPEGPFFQVPFAALKDENGKYLLDKVRNRLVPSLTTLKLIQASSADYHCSTGALIVGDPKVGRVEVNGKSKELNPLPCAREESQMIAKLLGVPCLVGEQATKEEVLRRIQEVSLVHIAAHGDAERGEIALAPNKFVTGIPTKEDFMLTVKDVAEVGIRAKLVVLSYCHSARGKILTAEGVVGIARAFLGSGARAALMSLSAVDDEATRAFMEIFYKCLIHEKMSASEALHQAMKQMRESLQYNDVKDWSPFVLLGDDVTFDFKK